MLSRICKYSIGNWNFPCVIDQSPSLTEDKVLNGDIYGLIAPYATANLWWWPYLRKFHHRYYDPIPDGFSDQEGFQSTFSVTKTEADIAAGLLNSGEY